jgi:hypothetical protein
MLLQEVSMTRKIGVLLLALPCLLGCKGEGEPGTFEKFLAPAPYKPGLVEEMCSGANDGKRYWLEGYLQLPSSARIEKGKTSLYFYDRIDGNGRGAGRSISIDVTSPGDIDDIWASATGKKPGGFRSQKAEIDPDALRIRAKNGEATARDKIKLTFDITPIRQFQTNEITACTYQFVKADKL